MTFKSAFTSESNLFVIIIIIKSNKKYLKQQRLAEWADRQSLCPHRLHYTLPWWCWYDIQNCIYKQSCQRPKEIWKYVVVLVACQPGATSQVASGKRQGAGCKLYMPQWQRAGRQAGRLAGSQAVEATFCQAPPEISLHTYETTPTTS